MKPFELNAEVRDAHGRAENRRLRRQGKVPAIIYGGNGDPVMLSVDHDHLDHHLENEAFYSHVIKIKVKGGSDEEAVLRDLQRHPAKPFIQHMDLLRVVAGEALRMNVPLHFIGEEEAPGTVEEDGIFQHSMNDVEVECLPRDLPEYIEVDCSWMGLSDAIHLSDLKVPEGVELVDLMHDTDRTVVTMTTPRSALELEQEEEALAEAEEGLEDHTEGEEAAEELEAHEEIEEQAEEDAKKDEEEE